MMASSTARRKIDKNQLRTPCRPVRFQPDVWRCRLGAIVGYPQLSANLNQTFAELTTNSYSDGDGRRRELGDISPGHVLDCCLK
jgi:hypothetical protein